jgi:hypothetical protein
VESERHGQGFLSGEHLGASVEKEGCGAQAEVIAEASRDVPAFLREERHHRIVLGVTLK